MRSLRALLVHFLVAVSPCVSESVENPTPGQVALTQKVDIYELEYPQYMDADNPYIDSPWLGRVRPLIDAVLSFSKRVTFLNCMAVHLQFYRVAYRVQYNMAVEVASKPYIQSQENQASLNKRKFMAGLTGMFSMDLKERKTAIASLDKWEQGRDQFDPAEGPKARISPIYKHLTTVFIQAVFQYTSYNLRSDYIKGVPTYMEAANLFFSAATFVQLVLALYFQYAESTENSFQDFIQGTWPTVVTVLDYGTLLMYLFNIYCLERYALLNAVQSMR